MNRILYFTVIQLLIAGGLSAQTIFLKDYSDHLPVEGANVKSLNSGQVYKSDENGKVVFKDVQSNDFFVVSCIGYSEQYVSINDIRESLVLFMFPRINAFDPVNVVYYYGKEERTTEVPNQIEIIKSSEIKLKNSQTSSDILQASGNVLVQKTQMGGGSPVLRGFESNKVLLVLDGVRMNNAIYRNGHLQNSITIDNNVLKQAEVIFGPGSVIYGSDALGGVIHYRTRDPRLTYDKTLVNSSASVTGRISSANQEKTYHFDASVGKEKFGMLTSLTSSEYGDLKMGKNRTHGDENWGLVPNYTDRIDGIDVILENPDPTIQKKTGYRQWDFLQKLVFAPKRELKFGLNFNYSTSTNIPRFDKYVETVDNGDLKWAEWDYGPQDRLFAALRVDWTDSTKLFDESHFVLGFQWINEERIQRRFGRTVREIQDENVLVYSLNTDFEKKLRKNYTLNYGLELTINEVSSEARTVDIESNEVGSFPTRYPDGGSDMQTFAAYVGAKKQINRKTKINLGGRYSRNILNASFISDEFYELPFDEIRFNNGAFTGSAGLMHDIDSTWQVNVVVSSGYRNPNVDDVGKVRENDGFVVVPNDEVKPEYAYNGEVTIIKSLFQDNVKITLTGFYTLLKNAIVTRDYQLNGADSLFIDGDIARITTNLNSSEAYVYGSFFGLSARINEDLTAQATFNYTLGEDKNFNVPLSHIPPVFGKIELKYQKDKFSGAVNAFYNGEKPIELFGAGSADSPSEALKTGSPAWWTLNTYSSFYVSPNIEIQFAVENILDMHYRQFSSGISAPGRNFILALRGSF